MDNKLLIVCLPVAVALIVIAAAFVALGDGDDDGNVRTTSAETNCWVYGNANMDNRVDRDDIEYLKLIISGDKERTAYADANRDGVINQEDIEVVQGIIDGTGGVRHYTMDNGEPGWIRGKVTSIGAQYYCNMYALAAMGATDIVTCGDDETAELANKGEFGEKVKSQGLKKYGYTGKYEPETLLSMKCQAILCGTSYFKNWEEKYWDDDTYIAFIRLACWKTDPIAAVVTVANLLENKAYVDKAIEYAEYASGINEKVAKAVSSLGSKKSAVIIYPYKDGSMEFQGPGTGCYEASLAAGLDNIASGICDPKKDNDGGFHVLSLEKALTYNPDAIMILKGCSWTATQENVDAAYADYVGKYLSTMDAVKNGNVWFTSWRFTQGVFQPVGAIMMASEIYGPELFDGTNAMRELQYYVDNFTSTNLGLDPGSDGYLDVTAKGKYFSKATNV